MRQDHRAPHGRRPGGHHQRHDRDRRPRGQRRAVQGPRRRDGVPELRAVPPPEGLRQHGLRPAAAQDRQERDRPARARCGEGPGPRGAAGPQAQEPVGRPAPAGGHGTRDRARAPRVPDGRTALEPGREAARADARRDRAAAGRPRCHDDLRHARPDRGDDDGRPRRRDQAGAVATGRHPAGPVRRTGQPVRRRVHRFTGDEHDRGHPRPRRRRVGRLVRRHPAAHWTRRRSRTGPRSLGSKDGR